MQKKLKIYARSYEFLYQRSLLAIVYVLKKKRRNRFRARQPHVSSSSLFFSFSLFLCCFYYNFILLICICDLLWQRISLNTATVRLNVCKQIKSYTNLCICACVRLNGEQVSLKPYARYFVILIGLLIWHSHIHINMLYTIYCTFYSFGTLFFFSHKNTSPASVLYEELVGGPRMPSMSIIHIQKHNASRRVVFFSDAIIIPSWFFYLHCSSWKRIISSFIAFFVFVRFISGFSLYFFCGFCFPLFTHHSPLTRAHAFLSLSLPLHARGILLRSKMAESFCIVNSQWQWWMRTNT